MASDANTQQTFKVSRWKVMSLPEKGKGASESSWCVNPSPGH
jgi:hypothetical protein